MRALLIVLLLLMGSNSIWMRKSRDVETLESCVVTFIDIFNVYAKSNGNSRTLSEEEYYTLIREQFPTLLRNPRQREIFLTSFPRVDLNRDLNIDIKEFVRFFMILASDLNQSLK